MRTTAVIAALLRSAVILFVVAAVSRSQVSLLFAGTLDRAGTTPQVQSTTSTSDAEKLYKENCAVCHESGSITSSKDEILDNLNSGSMKSQGSLLSPAEKQAVADYIVASRASEPGATPPVQPSKADVQAKPKSSDDQKK